MTDFGHPIVLDVGGAYVRSGFAGEHHPRHIEPSVIAQIKNWGNICRNGLPSSYIGEAAFDRSSQNADLLYPLERGFIDWDYHREPGRTYWDHHERLMHNAFYNSLKIEPEEHPILVTEAMFYSRSTRELLTQVMFDTFRSPALYLGLKPVLALLAAGTTTGLAVDSAVRERYKEPLEKMMMSRTHFKHDRTARMIKEQMCFVSEDYATFLRLSVKSEDSGGSDQSYLLPDGNTVDVGVNRFQIPEALFQPSILGRVEKGIHEVVADAIVASEPHMRDELIATIVLSGGNTKIRGFKNRLRNELISME
ncbi:Actin, aortic smooth muscle [Podila clonocystis]|nr:Actin, aortic smooth muscle [Podila clonocystis]